MIKLVAHQIEASPDDDYFVASVYIKTSEGYWSFARYNQEAQHSEDVERYQVERDDQGYTVYDGLFNFSLKPQTISFILSEEGLRGLNCNKPNYQIDFTATKEEYAVIKDSFINIFRNKSIAFFK